jgi:phosphomannomutase
MGEDVADPITFGTDGWRATLSTFTDERVRMVGQAVATYLRESDSVGGSGGEAAGPDSVPAVAVGYDARAHSRGFAEELARVLTANGFDVLLPERDVPTPVMAWTVRDRGLAGGLMVTASHNPPEYNGVKFVPGDGTPALPAVTDEIEAHLARPDHLPEAEWGTVRESDLVDAYLERVRSFVASTLPGGADLDGLPVVYDAMHGSGRGVTDELFERAGADVERLRCDRDPEFGGTAPEPVPERTAEPVERVRSGDAALGIINDGDADRVAIVTPERGFLDENLFFALLYDYLLEDDAGPAVRSVSTTFLIDRIARSHGEDVIEVPVGFKWVAEAMVDHDGLMGGEESGGFTVRGHVPEKDGVLMALYAATAEVAASLDDRVDRLLAEHGAVHQGKVSVDCPDDRKDAVVDALGDDIPDGVAGTDVDSVNDADGFKLLLVDGSWLLVRPSGTEPKLRVYAEADSDERVDELLVAGRELVAPLV